MNYGSMPTPSTAMLGVLHIRRPQRAVCIACRESGVYLLCQHFSYDEELGWTHLIVNNGPDAKDRGAEERRAIAVGEDAHASPATGS